MLRHHVQGRNYLVGRVGNCPTQENHNWSGKKKYIENIAAN